METRKRGVLPSKRPADTKPPTKELYGHSSKG